MQQIWHGVCGVRVRAHTGEWWDRLREDHIQASGDGGHYHEE